MSGVSRCTEAQRELCESITRGMKRYSTKDHARSRILDDNEVRKLWAACDTANGYGALVKLLLLTGQRREKVAAMRRQDIGPDGTWTIPSVAREKNNARELLLPKLALDIINERPRFTSNPYVIAGRAAGPIQASTVRVTRSRPNSDSMTGGCMIFAAHIAPLLSRAGVRPDIAEKVLGHAIKGVEGPYNRHSYREEKAHALKALAD